eukprot:7489283-Alexandrium_andersonii.AAC.1
MEAQGSTASTEWQTPTATSCVFDPGDTFRLLPSLAFAATAAAAAGASLAPAWSRRICKGAQTYWPQAS